LVLAGFWECLYMQKKNANDLLIFGSRRSQSLELLDHLGHIDGVFMADKTPPPTRKNGFRCVSCWYYPNQIPCWHPPPYRLNPKLTFVQWYEQSKVYLDWHAHLHTCHVLFAIEHPKPSVIIIAPSERELAATERKLGQAFASKLEDM
jgi:hypothetical protein